MRLLSIMMLLVAPAWAMDSTEILPRGVHSPAFRFGLVSGIDSKFSADGSVRTLNDINTVHFDSEQLSRMDADIPRLSAILNQYSQQQLGSQLHLGTLRVETEPEVKYVAPIYARGITDRLTLAAALPVVFYENKLELNQSASNVDAICSQFAGIRNDIPELDDACRQLNVKIADATRQELAKKGFKPLQDRKETVMGDMQLVSLWKAHEAGTHSSLLKTTLTLPTGQRNDPDDLADLGIFGNTALEPAFLFNYLPLKRVRLAAKAAYKFMVPDPQEMRVPGSEGDVLPGPETKEKLSRKIGDTATLGGAVNLAVWDSFALAGGYEYSRKAPDRYTGTRGARYDLLAKESDSIAHKARAGVSYDTIALYRRTQSFPPLKVDLEVINTFKGKNSDRQLVNELSLTMFF